MDRARFTERSSGFIRAQIVDQNGDPVDIGLLTVATLTLYDLDTLKVGVSPTGGIINSREDQNLLSGASPETGQNDVEFEADSYFRWDLQPEDNIIVTSRRQMERHKALFTFTWPTGNFNYEVEIEVTNLRKTA